MTGPAGNSELLFPFDRIVPLGLATGKIEGLGVPWGQSIATPSGRI